MNGMDDESSLRVSFDSDRVSQKYMKEDLESNFTVHEQQEIIKRKILLAKMAQQFEIDDYEDGDDELVSVESPYQSKPSPMIQQTASTGSLVSSDKDKRRGISRRFHKTLTNSSMSASQSDLMETLSQDSEDSLSDTGTNNASSSRAFDGVISLQEDFKQLNGLISQFDSCGFPVIIFDSYATLEYLNKEAEDAFGVYSFSVLGEHIAELFLEDSVCEIHDMIDEFFGRANNTSISHNGSIASLNLRGLSAEEIQKRKEKTLMKIRHLKGKAATLKKMFNVRARFIAIKKLSSEHFVAYLELTAATEEEQKEMASRKVYEAITDLSVIPIVSISQKCIIQTFNKACTEAFGYMKKDVLGKNVKMLCNDKDRAKHDYYVQRYLKTGEKRVVDIPRLLKARTKKAKLFKIELRVSEIVDSATSTSSFVGFIRDLKTMVTKEEQLTKLADKIFPKNVAQRISMGQQVIDVFEMCSVLFCDIVGFTKMSHGKRPEELVSMLHEIFGSFDDVCTAFQLEKIKTIGDAFFLASGVPKFVMEHADNIVKGGLAMVRVIQQFVKKHNQDLKVRIGIHSSADIIAAVVGRTKQTYDLFGKGVEVVKLVECTGTPNQIHISNSCYRELNSDKLKSLFVQRHAANVEIPLSVGSAVLPETTWITELQ